MAMVPEVKGLLLDALKSGEYEKTVGLLKRHNDDNTVGYCCLGVLSDIAATKGVCPGFERATDGEGYVEDWYFMKEEAIDYYGNPFMEHNTAFLPGSVAEWSGLDSETQTTLANINDNSEDFTEVIEYIETNL